MNVTRALALPKEQTRKRTRQINVTKALPQKHSHKSTRTTYGRVDTTAFPTTDAIGDGEHALFLVHERSVLKVRKKE
jgi:hypothetical protein